MAQIPWQEQLKIFQTDKAAAAQEIERAKSEYNKAKASGAPQERLNQISHWADQVRQAAGIANDDPVYGNDPRTYRGSSGHNIDPFTPQQFQMPDLSGAGTGASSQLMEAIFGMIGSGGGLNQGQLTDIRNAAQRKADQERQAYMRQLQMLQAQQQAALGNVAYGQQQLQMQQRQNLQNFLMNMATMNQQKSAETAALEAMMKQYGINRQTGLSQISDATEDAKAALENRSFQDYLETRQNIANRGLSGSGIAADADTRLALAKQQNLAGIMRDAATRQAELEAKYAANMDKAKSDASLLESKYGNNLLKLLSDMSNTSMNAQSQAFKLLLERGNTLNQFTPRFGDVFDKMNGISAEDYEREMLSDAQASADKNMNSRLQILSTLLGKLMPYDAMTMNQMAQLGLNYDKLNYSSLNDTLNRILNQSQFEQMMDYRNRQLEQNSMIDITKLLGMFPDGTPTLDAQKLAQQQAYQAQLIALRQQGLINDQQYQQAMMELNWSKMTGQLPGGMGPTLPAMQNDRATMTAMLSTIDRELSNLRQQYAQTPSPNIAKRMNELTSWKNQIMMTLSGTPSTPSYSAPPLGYTPDGIPIQGPPNPKR